MPLVSRRSTVTTSVGGVPIGSGHPVVVQSMTNTDTADVAATTRQVADLAAAGSELVRVTVNNEASAAAVPEIPEGGQCLRVERFGARRVAEQVGGVPEVGQRRGGPLPVP